MPMIRTVFAMHNQYGEAMSDIHIQPYSWVGGQGYAQWVDFGTQSTKKMDS